jgi:hypothetical protein
MKTAQLKLKAGEKLFIVYFCTASLTSVTAPAEYPTPRNAALPHNVSHVASQKFPEFGGTRWLIPVLKRVRHLSSS